MALEFTGRVEEIVYRNEDNGYTVMEVNDAGDCFTAVGVMPAVSPGQSVRLTGDWTQHRDFGPQFKVAQCETLAPASREDIVRYLGSGLIAGVGIPTARRIVDALGEGTLDVLRYDPERLFKVPGIGRKRGMKILEFYAQAVVMQELILFLQGHGMTTNLAVRVYKRYGESALARIQENPYRLAQDVEGIGFQTADRIAASMGIERDSPFRIAAGALAALNDALGDGHVYLPAQEAVRRAAALLKLAPDQVEEGFAALELAGSIVGQTLGDGRRLYLPAAYRAETEVARRLVDRGQRLMPLTNRMQEAVQEFQDGEALELDELQSAAIEQALQRGTVAITGGPGTGKTTIIRCILHALERSGMRVVLAAPTGRAAKRMAEAAGHEAATLHRLLEYGKGEESFQRDEDNPLEGDALVVDEASMIDIFLMNSLLRALPETTRLVLVGDADQLPSVGAGNVLNDIIASGQIAVVRLTRIFRQAAQSLIVVNAHRINQGQPPQLRARDRDFFFVREESMDRIGHTVVDLITRRLPGYTGLSPHQIQVLSPMRRGPSGVQELNAQLQQALNPPDPAKRERITPAALFREGDRIMQVRNDYQLSWVDEDGREGEGVYNGDMGLLTAIDPQQSTASLAFDDGRCARYDFGQMDELELAYAITVHKSQGSEFEAVVLPLMGGPPMLMTRNLLYTAVTRARKFVILVGRESCIREMVANDFISRRFSALDERLRELAGAI